MVLRGYAPFKIKNCGKMSWPDSLKASTHSKMSTSVPSPYFGRWKNPLAKVDRRILEPLFTKLDIEDGRGDWHDTADGLGYACFGADFVHVVSKEMLHVIDAQVYIQEPC